MSARRLVSRFLVRPISPDRLSTWSRRAVSTRMVVSRTAALSSPRRPPGAALATAPGLSLARRPSGGKCGCSLAASTATGAGCGGALTAAAPGDAVADGDGDGGTATDCPACGPTTAWYSSCQSGPAAPPSSTTAGDACGAAAMATAAVISSGVASDPARAARKLPLTSAGAGAGCRPCPISPNMLRTPCVAAMMVSISSGFSVCSPFLSLSKRFSVRWQSFTSSLALRKPAPPLMV